MLVGLLLACAAWGKVLTKLKDGKRPPQPIPCTADGSECHVYCDNGDRAGIMTFNGSVWTDAVRTDKDMEKEADLIVKASGTACK